MNGNASHGPINHPWSVLKPIYILAAIAHWLRHWPVKTKVFGSSPVIGNHVPPFSIIICYLITCKQPCE